MAKSFKVIKKSLNMGEFKGQTVYTVSPMSYGKRSTDDAARQIAEESSLTSADVKSVLDRYAYYIKENLKIGYDVEMLGLGTMSVKFLKTKSVKNAADANSSLVRGVIPTFRPSYTMTMSGNRVYDLIPTKISIVKFGDEVSTTTADDSSSDTGGSTSGSDTGSDTRSDSGTDTGSDDTGDDGFQG